MIRLSTLFVCLFSIGCAHQKMAYKEIHFPYSHDLLEEVQSSGRFPASIVDTTNEIPSRRLYFSVLYKQYKMLNAHFDSESEVKFCPQFHSEKITADNSINNQIIVQKQINHPSHTSFFPEQVFQGDYSFKDYHQSIFSELLTLCEEGVSENFYKFDNLLTYHANRIDFHQNPMAMEALLKIPVFANFYLLRMIQSEALPYPYSTEDKNLIQITQTHWFERYVREAREVRKTLLNNRTVQR